MLKQLQSALVLPRQIMLVSAVNADGTVTASSASGHTIRAIGTATVGDHVYVQDGRVLGSAPDLPFVEIEV
ncbi:hypothetical protein [Shewanella putrefaciens]|uniref:Uncharacterized protein n=1 Tax=Shewanella putrefaciens TaxID=24 RepID=A0ABX8X7I8_SHEPU|nr:hypothetical protein [Shewanella putrefaciens]MCT8943744.1 hypothetical protein [Shewanella putrefaciens]QSE47965.1 hypothetical protein JW975_11200 [Shewanella putrefaciens]QYX71368.1 hypothetical protein K3G22_11190 [Shewanella putrefaciens]GGN23358.1 hypothetical protein GCM10007984_24040 [Shewanella putrefaciens]